jgi:salicylate hydroxylase
VKKVEISNVSIVGAGISGLTAGCALLSRGIEASIYERSEYIEEFGAGITLSANATRLLERLEILPELTKVSYLPTKIIIRNYSSGEEIARIPINITKPNEFITTDRRDLINVLLRRYKSLNGNVNTACEVLEIDFDKKELVCSNGKRQSSEVFLGCDGIRSKIREKYFDNSKPIYTNFLAWRGIADITNLPKFKDSEEINLYYGPNGHVVHYPIGTEGKINFVGVKNSQHWTKESWKEEGSKEDLLKDFSTWNNSLLSLMTSPEKVFKWGIFERPKIQSIQKRNIALLGDAAHPMVPFLGQGGCMAIEDAYCFGLLYSKLENSDKALNLYQQIRLKRGNWVQKRSKLQARFNHISNPTLVKLRNLLAKKISINAVRSVHSYDADKESIKRIKT